MRCSILVLIVGIGAAARFTLGTPKNVSGSDLEIWYILNVPLGVAKGYFPGRAAWGDNPHIASWDGKTVICGKTVSPIKKKQTSCWRRPFSL